MSRQIQDVYICEALRTPVGKAIKGSFQVTRPDDLLAHCLRGIKERHPQIPWQDVGDVIVGCAMPEAEQGMNVARIATLLAGLPHQVPGQTINRFCSSGLQAIGLAADRIMMGEEDLMIAGGTESMSLIPMMGHKVVMNPLICKDENRAIAFGMGITAEKVAQQWKVTREQQDQFALESHRRACMAIAEKEFATEILPYEITKSCPSKTLGKVDHKTATLKNDEGPRPDTTAAGLAKLRPVFHAKGSVTAGNSSQMSDGAGALLLASEAAVKKYNLKPLAKFHGMSVAGVPPEIMGIGPIEAIPKVLKKVNLTINDMDWIELNEAFAAQSVAVISELKLDPAKVNPLGGAIALGHPLGATGAIRAATLIHGMRRRKQKYGMVTMCIGTGMGAAGVFEAL